MIIASSYFFSILRNKEKVEYEKKGPEKYLMKMREEDEEDFDSSKSFFFETEVSEQLRTLSVVMSETDYNDTLLCTD